MASPKNPNMRLDQSGVPARALEKWISTGIGFNYNSLEGLSSLLTFYI